MAIKLRSKKRNVLTDVVWFYAHTIIRSMNFLYISCMHIQHNKLIIYLDNNKMDIYRSIVLKGCLESTGLEESRL